MVFRPAEKDLVRVFVNNLLPKYKNHFKYLGIDKFTKLYDIGVQIQMTC